MSLSEELKELLDRFIKIKKQSLKDKTNEELENNA